MSTTKLKNLEGVDTESVEFVVDFLVSGSKMEITSSEQPMTVRLPFHVYSQIKAIATHSETSMNTVVVMMVQAMIREARPGLQAAGVDIDAEWMEQVRKSVPAEASIQRAGQQMRSERLIDGGASQ